MTLAGPRGEDQQQASVLGGADLVALGRVPLGEQARAAAHGVALRADEVDAASDDDQPRALVHLVLVERLAGGKLDRYRPALFGGGQDLRMAGLDGKLGEVPALHQAGTLIAPRPVGERRTGWLPSPLRW